MLVKELREEAKKLNIEGYKKMKKAELELAISNAGEHDVFEVHLKNKETTLKYPIDADSKANAIEELHKLLRLPNHNQYKEMVVLMNGNTILNITR